MKAEREHGGSTLSGEYGSDYAGMSSEKRGENPRRRKPKVSWARPFLPGLVGT